MIEKCFFNRAMGDAVGEIGEGTFPVVHQGRDKLTEDIVIKDPVFLDGFNALLRHIGLIVLKLVLQDRYFRFLERRARIPADTAGPLALRQVAAEADHVKVVRNGNVAYQDHSPLFDAVKI